MLSTDLNEPTTDTNESNVKQLVESTDHGSNNIENSSLHGTGNEGECNDVVIDRDELINEATNLLNEGKKFLSVKDYTNAANTLLMACCKYCEIYGDFSDECGDVYFYYGCALLELETINNKSPRTYIKGNVSKIHINTSAMEVNDQEGKEENLSENVLTDETLTRSSEDCKDESGNESSRKEEVTKKNEDTEENTMNPVDFDETQLVPEILELAKDIFIRQNNVEKLINTYLNLGKAYMASGDYSKAIANTEQCLNLQEKQIEPAKNEIVDTVMQLGTACALSGQYYTAVRHFTSAGIILEKYIRYLSRTLDSDGEDDVCTDDIHSEVVEARSLLKSIKDKICEAEDQIRATVNSKPEPKNNGVTKLATDNGSKALSGFSSEIRINIVSNFLRRKRKLIINDSGELKKPRLETSV